MNKEDVNLQTRAKGYGGPEPPQGEDVPISLGGPLKIPHPSGEQIPRIPKALVSCKPHMKYAHNYSILDDLS